jgi:hypothetical protein
VVGESKSAHGGLLWAESIVAVMADESLFDSPTLLVIHTPRLCISSNRSSVAHPTGNDTAEAFSSSGGISGHAAW